MRIWENTPTQSAIFGFNVYICAMRGKWSGTMWNLFLLPVLRCAGAEHLPEKWQEYIWTHYTLSQGRNLENFESATSKGIWRSCFVYVQKRAVTAVCIRKMAWVGCIRFYRRWEVFPGTCPLSDKSNGYCHSRLFFLREPPNKGMLRDKKTRKMSVVLKNVFIFVVNREHTLHSLWNTLK